MQEKEKAPAGRRTVRYGSTTLANTYSPTTLVVRKSTACLIVNGKAASGN